MEEVRRYLAERTLELGLHLDLLRALDARTRETLKSDDPLRVDIAQIKILKSGSVVHMYNIVEATVARTLERLEAKVLEEHPRHYTNNIFELWVKGAVKIDNELNLDKLRKRVVGVGRMLIDGETHGSLDIAKTDGNWDEERLDKLLSRLEIDLVLAPELRRLVREPVLNDNVTRLKLVRKLRNDLGHGFVTFEEGAASLAISDLQTMAFVTVAYCRSLVEAFDVYIYDRLFLKKALTAA